MVVCEAHTGHIAVLERNLLIRGFLSFFMEDREWNQRVAELLDALNRHLLAIQLLQYGDIMALQVQLEKGNYSFFTCSRDNGVLRQESLVVEAECNMASTSYDGTGTPQPSQRNPQNLHFLDLALPDKYDGALFSSLVTCGC